MSKLTARLIIVSILVLVVSSIVGGNYFNNTQRDDMYKGIISICDSSYYEISCLSQQDDNINIYFEDECNGYRDFTAYVAPGYPFEYGEKQEPRGIVWYSALAFVIIMLGLFITFPIVFVVGLICWMMYKLISSAIK